MDDKKQPREIDRGVVFLALIILFFVSVLAFLFFADFEVSPSSPAEFEFDRIEHQIQKNPLGNDEKDEFLNSDGEMEFVVPSPTPTPPTAYTPLGQANQPRLQGLFSKNKKLGGFR